MTDENHPTAIENTTVAIVDNSPLAGEKLILKEVDDARKEIKTDNYHMSIGELISLYLAGDIILNPAYQRLFRWDDEQKTYFIESLILGIPVPPIFVAQKEDGKWEIVDGLQRISTILQLTGDLASKPILTLSACKYLPAIEGKTWGGLPAELQRLIKRSKITVNIILTANSSHSQYEVFQRLNTGGLHLSDQEIRNCLIIMNNENFYSQINSFKNNPVFTLCTPMTSDREDEEYRMELILRYLIAKARVVDFSKYKLHQILVRDFIDGETVNLIKSDTFNLAEELELLNNSLTILTTHLGQDTFSKYLPEREAYDGKFSIQLYEALLPGFTANIGKFTNITEQQLKDLISELCSRPEFTAATGRGVKALKRFKDLTELSFNFFDAI